MSLFSENIIPGNHGKLFSTNAKEDSDLNEIKKGILTIEGVKNVAINNAVFPRAFTVYTTKIMRICDIENKVKTLGFHAIPQ